MKGWVGLVGWPIADGLPTQVVTHQLQVERRTAKAQRPKTDVLPLDHTTKSILVCENSKMESIKFDKKFQLKYIDQPRRVWRSFWSKVFHTWHGRSLSVCHSSEPFNNGSTGWAQGTMYCHFQFQYSHTFHPSLAYRRHLSVFIEKKLLNCGDVRRTSPQFRSFFRWKH